VAERITVALAGNPNSEKTTIFNNLVLPASMSATWRGRPSSWAGFGTAAQLHADLERDAHRYVRTGGAYLEKADTVIAALLTLMWALMVSTLIYMPSMVALAVWHREAGSRWRWTLFFVAYTTVLAWIVALGTYKAIPAFGIRKADPAAIQDESEDPWTRFLRDSPTAGQTAHPPSATHMG